MKNLIVVSSLHGNTQKCVELINEGLLHKADIIDIKDNDIALTEYDNVFIASSIYGGKFQKETKIFLNENKDEINIKKIGFIISCKDENDIEKYLIDNLPKNMMDNVSVIGHVGYEINLEKMNFFERFLLKNLFQIKKSSSQINKEGISKIINEINKYTIS